MASIASALGSDVQPFVRKHPPLRQLDLLIVGTLVEVMNTEGLMLQLESGREQTVDCLIWAIGREPANDNINLDAAGLAHNSKGYTWWINSRTPRYRDNTGTVELTPVAVVL